MVARTQAAPMVTLLTIRSGDVVQLESPLTHVLHVVNDVPEHTLSQGRRREATTIEPALAHVNASHQVLQIDAFAQIVLMLATFALLVPVGAHDRVLVLDDLREEPLKEVHVVCLGLGEALLFGQLKEQRGHHVAPLVKQVLLVLLNVHKLMHYMQLQIELPAVNRVL